MTSKLSKKDTLNLTSLSLSKSADIRAIIEKTLFSIANKMNDMDTDEKRKLLRLVVDDLKYRRSLVNLDKLRQDADCEYVTLLSSYDQLVTILTLETKEKMDGGGGQGSPNNGQLARRNFAFIVGLVGSILLIISMIAGGRLAPDQANRILANIADQCIRIDQLIGGMTRGVVGTRVVEGSSPLFPVAIADAALMKEDLMLGYNSPSSELSRLEFKARELQDLEKEITIELSKSTAIMQLGLSKVRELSVIKNLRTERDRFATTSSAIDLCLTDIGRESCSQKRQGKKEYEDMVKEYDELLSIVNSTDPDSVISILGEESEYINEGKALVPEYSTILENYDAAIKRVHSILDQERNMGTIREYYNDTNRELLRQNMTTILTNQVPQPKSGRIHLVVTHYLQKTLHVFYSSLKSSLNNEVVALNTLVSGVRFTLEQQSLEKQWSEATEQLTIRKGMCNRTETRECRDLKANSQIIEFYIENLRKNYLPVPDNFQELAIRSILSPRANQNVTIAGLLRKRAYNEFRKTPATTEFYIMTSIGGAVIVFLLTQLAAEASSIPQNVVRLVSAPLGLLVNIVGVADDVVVAARTGIRRVGGLPPLPMLRNQSAASGAIVPSGRRPRGQSQSRRGASGRRRHSVAAPLLANAPVAAPILLPNAPAAPAAAAAAAAAAAPMLLPNAPAAAPVAPVNAQQPQQQPQENQEVRGGRRLRHTRSKRTSKHRKNTRKA